MLWFYLKSFRDNHNYLTIKFPETVHRVKAIFLCHKYLIINLQIIKKLNQTKVNLLPCQRSKTEIMKIDGVNG